MARIAGTALDDTLWGTDLDDLLEGFEGDDFLYGYEGNDELEGGSGADFLDGGDGIDTAIYRNSPVAVSVYLHQGFGIGGDAEGDTFSGIENVFGSMFDDTLYGNDLDNTLAGEGGNDRLIGLAGLDTLLGGDGDDLLYGYDGDDELEGGAGADFLDGGEGNDTAVYWNSPFAVDVNLYLGYGRQGDAEGDSFSGIENVFGSAFDDDLSGNDLDNILTGDGGNDYLSGFAGSDTLLGGDGNDNLRGDTGADRMLGGDGDDNLRSDDTDPVLDGGAGFDYLYIDRSTLSDDIVFSVADNLDGGFQELPDGTVIRDIEAIHFIAGAGNDRLTNLYSRGWLEGGAGDDVLIGGDQFGGVRYESEFFWGGAGNDWIDGGADDPTPNEFFAREYAFFSSVISDYSIVLTGVDSAIVTDLRPGSPDGTDTLVRMDGMFFDYQPIPINQAPTALELSASVVEENAAQGTIFGTFAGIDPNPGEQLRYYFLDNAGDRFSIDYFTGEIAVADGSLLDAEQAASHQVTVRVIDTNSNPFDRTFTINVANLNEAPVIDSNGGLATAAISIAENSTAVTTVTARDPDAAATISFAIAGGADAARFVIDFYTGALRFISAPDFELRGDANGDNVYDVQVRASDGPLSDTQAIAVTVTDQNEAPVIDSNGGLATAAISIAENSTAVTTVTARDPDAVATISFAIAGGADAARFTIDANTGALRFIAAPDFELRGDANGDNVYDVQVRASDGQLSDTQAIAVRVTDVSESSVGTPGNDVLVGTPLGDQLRGLAGNDTLAGLGGGDTLDGGAGIDTADYSASPRGVIVNLGTGVALLGDAQGDRLVSIEQILGSAFNDSLIGDGAANYLNGNDGNDGLVGGAGDDVLVGGLGDDSLFGGAGDDVLLGGPGGNWLDGGAGADYLEGGDQFDLLIGGDGADTLIGGGGSDILEGGAGADVIVGGLGDDDLIGGSGADSFRGGEGRDTVSYIRPYSPFGVTVDLALGTATGGDAEGDTLLGVENIYGSWVNDVLRGDESANTLTGAGGDDVLSGFGGNDLIIGRIGKDVLAGGSGADAFLFDGGLLDSPVGTGADTILDFGHGIDSIDLSVLDARTNVAGNQAFAFIGGAAFSGISGQLRYQYDLATQTTRCFADVNGDRAPDFQINLAGQIALTASDFIL